MERHRASAGRQRRDGGQKRNRSCAHNPPSPLQKAIIVMTLLLEWQHRRRQCSRKRPKAWPEQIGWIVPAFFRPSCAATGDLSAHLDVEHHPGVEQSWHKIGTKRGGGLRRGTTLWAFMGA